MPFVDLNNPDQNESNVSKPVDASSKPPAMKSVATDAPPPQPKQDGKSSNNKNKQKDNNQNKKDDKQQQKQDDHMNDEHTLMRDVPDLGDGNAKVDESGIKEIKGPPIGERADSKAQNNSGQSPTQKNKVKQVPTNLTNKPMMNSQNNTGGNDNSSNMSNNDGQANAPTNSAPASQNQNTNQMAGNSNQLANDAGSQVSQQTQAAPQANTQQQQPVPVQTNNAPIVPQPSNDGLPPLPKLDNSVPVGQQPQTPAPPVNMQDNGFNLQGSAQGKEQVVEEIFKKADQSIAEKQKQQEALQPKPMAHLETADEKFINANATLSDLLSITEKRDASDLHLSVDYPPILRVDGKLASLGGTPLTDERIQQLFDQILTQAQKEQLEKDLDLDFSHTHTSGSRFRINIFHKKGSLAGAFRLIPSRIRSIAELNLPNILYDLVTVPQGLIILAGPTGSGKSTTIASMVQEVNLSQPKHIVTIEDPIEYIFPKGTALINQREIGTDATSFKRALREVLREDPDVVLVGEMRDYEAISMTITTAETGHLVFSTLHTNSASQTVDRMIDVFPDAQQAQVRAQLANVIAAVISQRLAPVKGGGRKAVLEVMIATPAIRNAIREGKTYQIDNMIQTNAEIGMITLEKSLIDLIKAGEITLEDAQTYTTKPEELISLMKNN